ncbi:MAG: thiamine biosynthesis lipoprotein, partial [Candidatus Azotimanducaceae bacterium]
LSLIGWEKVERSLEQIYLPQPGMQIDLGGVVKEYVADALIELISATGIKNALVNLGGDIAVLGPQPSGEPWHIGVTDPDNPGSAVASIDLSEGAITTSGGYERVFEIEGHPYSHLLNPKNGMPVDNLLGVSIVAPQAIVAGSLSTIALLKPEQEAKKWLEDCGAPYLAIDRQRDISGSLATTR